MKCLVLVLLPSLAFAEAPAAPVGKPPEVSPLKATPDVSLSPLHLLPSDLDRIEHRARIRRNTGIGLAIPGVVLLVLGSVLIGASARDTSVFAADGARIGGGAIAASIGVLFTIPGAYLWIEGQESLDTAAWRRQRALPDGSLH
jgi:hypothetical protein